MTRASHGAPAKIELVADRSAIRYYCFKDLSCTRKHPAFLIFFLILIGAVIWAFSEVVLISLACTYAVVGVLLHLVRFIRHRMVSRTA